MSAQKEALEKLRIDRADRLRMFRGTNAWADAFRRESERHER